jgi:endo-1,3-1,4-beta-glycanase ExoK
MAKSLALLVLSIALLLPTAVFAVNPVNITDPLTAENPTVWTKSSWKNGDFFNVIWKATHVTFDGTQMKLQMDEVDVSKVKDKVDFASGEYRTNDAYPCWYGTYQVDMKVDGTHGALSSIFTYTGPAEGNPHDEIDFEILGRFTGTDADDYSALNDATHSGYPEPTGGIDPSGDQIIECNMYYNDSPSIKVCAYEPSYDPTQAFHTYKFEWVNKVDGSAKYVKWYVDNSLEAVWAPGSASELPTHASRAMMNLWSCRGPGQTGYNADIVWWMDFLNEATNPVCQAFYKNFSYVVDTASIPPVGFPKVYVDQLGSSPASGNLTYQARSGKYQAIGDVYTSKKENASDPGVRTSATFNTQWLIDDMLIDTDSGTTSSAGLLRIYSDWRTVTTGSHHFDLNVVSVSKSGYNYDPTANIEPTDYVNFVK